MKRFFQIDFVRFCLVGAGGFAINFALLTLFSDLLGLNIALSQFLASEVALFHNFLWHHYWTYKRNMVVKSIPSLLIQFHATSWVAIIGTTLLVTYGVSVLELPKIVALIISSFIAMFWNFGWTKFYIWRRKEKPANDDSPKQ